MSGGESNVFKKCEQKKCASTMGFYVNREHTIACIHDLAY